MQGQFFAGEGSSRDWGAVKIAVLCAAALLFAPIAGAQTSPQATTTQPLPLHHKKTHHPPAPLRTPTNADLAVKPPALHKAVTPHHSATPRKPPPPPGIGTNSGLKLPRFESLKSNEVNMRYGPGERYPVEWQYKRRSLPVKIEREFDVWRMVEDMDGIKGWVNQGMLTGRRSFVVIGTANVALRASASETSAIQALLQPGVVGKLKSCDPASTWCAVDLDDFHGFLRRSDFYGALDGEAVAP